VYLLGYRTVDSSPGAKGRITSETSGPTRPHRSLALKEVKRTYIEGEVLQNASAKPTIRLKEPYLGADNVIPLGPNASIGG